MHLWLQKFAARCLLLATALGALTQCAPPRPGTGPAELAQQLGDDEPLLGFFRALDGAAERPVTVLQIGDSHTASDAFSGRMRELLQQRFGNAGRGLLPPGIPFRYYRPSGVSVSSRGWSVLGGLKPTAPGPFGITGFRQHATGVADMSLEAADPGDLAEREVEVLMQPGGGHIGIESDGASVFQGTTAAPERRAAWIGLPAAAPSTRLTVRALGDGPVDILAWRVQRHGAGISYSNLGIIGATVNVTGNWDPATVTSEMQAVAPSLLIVAFGTNEGFNDSLDVALYRRAYVQRVAALRAAAGGPSLVVVGPPEGLRKRKGGAAACGDAEWAVPRNLDPVRQAVRDAGKALDAKYWDWQAAMGGPCSLPGLIKAGAAAKDRVHFLAPGYRMAADALFSELMAGYDRYRRLAAGR